MFSFVFVNPSWYREVEENFGVDILPDIIYLHFVFILR